MEAADKQALHCGRDSKEIANEFFLWRSFVFLISCRMLNYQVLRKFCFEGQEVRVLPNFSFVLTNDIFAIGLWPAVFSARTKIGKQSQHMQPELEQFILLFQRRFCCLDDTLEPMTYLTIKLPKCAQNLMLAELNRVYEGLFVILLMEICFAQSRGFWGAGQKGNNEEYQARIVDRSYMVICLEFFLFNGF